MAQQSTPPFSLLHFVPEMDVFTAAQPATVLHPPYYYRRYFGSHTDHSALSLSLVQYLRGRGWGLCLLARRRFAPPVRRRSVNLTSSPLCLLPSPFPISLSFLCFDYFSDSQGAAPTKWLFRGRPLFRSSFVASSRSTMSKTSFLLSE